MWYIDSGASFHITGDKWFFGSLEEKDLQLPIELGDYGRYSTKGIIIVTSERESNSHLHLNNVMCVLILKKKLVYVIVLEGARYDAMFSTRKAYLKHVALGQVKQIGVRIENLYKFEVDACVALSIKVESSQRRDVVVDRERDKALNMEHQLDFQFQYKPAGSWVGQ